MKPKSLVDIVRERQEGEGVSLAKAKRDNELSSESGGHVKHRCGNCKHKQRVFPRERRPVRCKLCGAILCLKVGS